MSAASRTACTSWGVIWTLPRVMARFTFSGAQSDHGRAVAPLVGSSGADRRDSGVAAQVVPHGLAQASGAVAVDHTDLATVRQERLIEITVELLQGWLDPLADQVDLRRELDRLVEVAAAGAEIRSIGPIRPISPAGARGRQLLGAAAQALPLDHDLGAAGLQLLEDPLPAEPAVAHLRADREDPLGGLGLRLHENGSRGEEG